MQFVHLAIVGALVVAVAVFGVVKKAQQRKAGRRGGDDWRGEQERRHV